MRSRNKAGVNRKEFIKLAGVAGSAGLWLLVPKSGMRRANNYYVSNTGWDGSPGTIARPWKTIERVNTAKLYPGDQVLFNRGETFTGRIVPKNSGDETLDINYGGYGIGDRPIIDGSASSALYIQNNKCHYMRFENLDFSGASGINACTVRCLTDHVYFYNCVFRDSRGGRYGYGFYAYTNGAGAKIHHITLDNCIATNNNASGIHIGSGLGTGGPHDCLIINCSAYENGSNTSADHGIYVRHGVIIDGCTTYNNRGGGLKVNCQGVHDSPYTPVVRNCVSYGNRVGLIAENVKSIIYNNLMYRNVECAIENLSSDGSGSVFYFNTFANMTSGYGLVTLNGYSTSDMVFKNNIFVQNYKIRYGYILSTHLNRTSLADAAANNKFDYNVYYHDGSQESIFGRGYDGQKTFALWKAMTGSTDANSTLLTELPDFVKRYSDFHPADGGNLKGLGISIKGFELDKDGNVRSDPPTPGCYEQAIG